MSDTDDPREVWDMTPASDEVDWTLWVALLIPTLGSIIVFAACWIAATP